MRAIPVYFMQLDSDSMGLWIFGFSFLVRFEGGEKKEVKDE